MATDQSTTGDDTDTSTLSIPKKLLEQYPELIAFIRQSESMNNEERQYWINILPVMTEPQVNNLMQILRTERKELDAIDKKYADQVDEVTQKETARQKQVKKEKKRRVRVEKEAEHHEEAQDHAEDILGEIEGL